MQDNRVTLDIKHDFQRQLVLQTVLTLFITINMVVIALTLYTANQFGPPPLWIPMTLVAAEIVIFYVVYRRSMAASHTIAGPVFVFEKALEGLARGELDQRVKLRETDQFQETAEILNRALEAVSTRVRKFALSVKTLESLPDINDETRAVVAQLRNQLDDFKLSKAGESKPTDRAD